jgi:hypothetical protein
MHVLGMLLTITGCALMTLAGFTVLVTIAARNINLNVFFAAMCTSFVGGCLIGLGHAWLVS